MYVELKNINKNFGNFKASDNVSFGIEKGKLIGLLGPSGSGKTTILRMIAGLEAPDNGDIIIDGKSDSEIKNRVAELVKLIGLEGLENRYPSQLSGGQRQRVAFARALAPNPQLLLLDEPFAAIDAKVRQELRHWLKEMIAKLGVTSIFVTHDQDEAIEVADEIIIMNKGRIDQIGKPLDVYSSPKTAFVASFFGQPSIFKDYSKFRRFDAIEGAEQAIVRPEFVKVTKKTEVQKYKNSAEEGVATDVAFRGSGIELSVLVNSETLTARRSFDEPGISVGEKVDIFIYRIFVTVGESAFLLENKSLREPVVVI